MATLNDADDVWARYASLPRDYKDAQIAEVILRLEQEARAYRDALAPLEFAVNKSISGMEVLVGEWLDLIGRAQRALRKADERWCTCEHQPSEGARFCSDCGRRVYWMENGNGHL